MNLAEQEVDILDHICLKPDESLRIRDLWMEINQCRAFGSGKPYAYTTVAAVVQNLRDKGAVENAGGRLDGYRPVYATQARAGDRMDEAWKRVPDPDAAMQHFLSGMTEAELGRVERALASVRARPAARQEEPSVRERPAPQERPLPPALGGREQRGEDHNDDPNVLISGLLELQMKARRTTKRAVANRIGIHEKTVANRMARAAGLSSEVLGELVEALDTPDDIRAAIFRLVGRVAPPKKAGAPWLSPGLPAYRAYLDSIKRPSVLYDIGWRVVYCNKAYRELFSPGPHIPVFPGSMALENGVLYMLRHPNAARLLGAGSMEAYERHWCTLALAHFAAAYQENRDDPSCSTPCAKEKRAPASTPPTKAQRNGSGNTATSP
ncbi:BlaI/MecI/CopY family transcriptional regulator [Streptomyces rimosus]|uniref:BlaI/MecI/CopY family transcriptional regulator n=1 Tax=Streptomyces rimosus TaxID=1927 RepID=UPI0037BB2178